MKFRYVAGLFAFFLLVIASGVFVYQISKPDILKLLSVASVKRTALIKEVKNAQDIQSPPYEQYIVAKVIDGDTIKLSNGKTVRYIGINAPETVDPRRPVQCYGKEASAKNKELVEGKLVNLVKDVSETDKYGRLLRYVYVGDIFVNEYLVKEGYAYASSYPPDISMQQIFLNAQRHAQLQHEGLWNKCVKIQ